MTNNITDRRNTYAQKAINRDSTEGLLSYRELIDFQRELIEANKLIFNTLIDFKKEEKEEKAGVFHNVIVIAPTVMAGLAFVVSGGLAGVAVYTIGTVSNMLETKAKIEQLKIISQISTSNVEVLHAICQELNNKNKSHFTASSCFFRSLAAVSIAGGGAGLGYMVRGRISKL